LLLDVTVAPFSSLDQGAGVLTLLSSPQSPLRQFLLAASRETTLTGKEKVGLATVGDAVKDKLAAYKSEFEGAIGANADDALPAAKSANPVDRHFDELHRSVSASAPGAPLPLDAVLAQLKDVAIYFDAAAAAKRGGAVAPAGEAVAKLKREAQSQPASLAAILLAIDGSAAGLTSGSERDRLNSLWGGSGGQFCDAAIKGRYPMLRTASSEVTADDFGKFFAPGGLMDDFFQRNLLQHVDMGAAQWRWRTAVPALGMSQEVLDGFQRAARIRDAFFGGGGRQPSIRFELKPLAIDAGLGKLTLNIDGQQLVHASDAAAHTAAFQLPSGKGNGQVYFETTPPGLTALRTEGNWAWFRMLDKGTLEAGATGERYTLRFDFGGKKAAFEMTASSVINPFRRDMLERFRCISMLQ
jgi:type VI secretion system protein ImpL